MSIKCIADRYTAYRITLRVSVEFGDVTDKTNIREIANYIAGRAEKQFGTKGSNILYGHGRWDNRIENGATIEIVVRDMPINEDMEKLSYACNVGAGVSCFATVETTTAYELYELAE